MAKKEERRREIRPKIVKEKKGPKTSWIQVILGVGALTLAANSYFSYYSLPKFTLEIFLVTIGAYQLFRVQERKAYSRRLDIIKRHM